MKVLHILITGALLLSASGLRAQTTDANQHERTAPIPEARFEIMQSSIAARLTLRVDRFSGATSQLVIRADSSIAWQEMMRLSHRDPDTRVTSRANYQVFTSGLGLSFTFLVNVNTGATWQLKEDSRTGWYWDPIS
jgi:hypothetical protein